MRVGFVRRGRRATAPRIESGLSARRAYRWGSVVFAEKRQWQGAYPTPVGHVVARPGGGITGGEGYRSPLDASTMGRISVEGVDKMAGGNLGVWWG